MSEALSNRIAAGEVHQAERQQRDSKENGNQLKEALDNVMLHATPAIASTMNNGDVP